MDADCDCVYTHMLYTTQSLTQRHTAGGQAIPVLLPLAAADSVAHSASSPSTLLHLTVAAVWPEP